MRHDGAHNRDDQPYVLVDVAGVPVDSVTVSVGDTQNPAPGLVVRFENAFRSLDRKLAYKHEWIDELTTEINRGQGELGKSFQHQDALHAAYAARKAINDKLAAAAAPPPAPSPAAADPDVAAALGALAATHADPPPGQRPGSTPSTARPYSPPAPEHDSTLTLD